MNNRKAPGFDIIDKKVPEELLRVWYKELLDKIKSLLPHPFYEFLKSFNSNKIFQVKENDFMILLEECHKTRYLDLSCTRCSHLTYHKAKMLQSRPLLTTQLSWLQINADLKHHGY
ncbi:hypothetical protein EVAR_75433_1 [Eumeta japonica]|uniref:Uncharacterized protein n=1 Tax=Eumeta variegata TaxID=151549 RepID=A0A4C1TL74_EUMVA|nr:hypothetical protein EVAR_75433_1 [Eumeta japonica]